MTDLKLIYSFTVLDKDSKNHFFGFKKPSRAEREDADMWHGAWVEKYLQAGLSPMAIMVKRYANADGTFDKAQKAEYDDVSIQLRNKEEELEKVMPTDLSARDRVTIELLDLRERFIRLQQSQESFFANTAESKGRIKLIEWLILHLSYHRVDESKPWEPFFGGEDTAAKLVTLDKLEEAADDMYLKSRGQLSFIAALWVSLDGNLKKEDIDAFLKAPTLAALEPATPDASVPPEVQSQPAA